MLNTSPNNTKSKPNSPFYKVNHLVNGVVESIFVFYGKKILPEDEMASQEYVKILQDIFTEEEVEYINENDIKPIFLEEQIHFDDTIGAIKIKILEQFKSQTCFEEIYLFCEKTESLNSVDIYQSLTQNKKISLTKQRLDQFLTNIVKGDFSLPPDKEVYDYDDILSMKIDNKEFVVDKVLGQKFFIVENEYPFICNPYKVNSYDNFFERNSRKSLTTLNNHLLLNTGKIKNNNIYVCLAREVLFSNQQNDIDQKTTIKIYYPFLFSKNIFSLEDIEEKSIELIDGNSKLLTEKNKDYFDTIDMFYEVEMYQKPGKELNYLSRGIKYIRIVIKPEFTIKIPLETIFKIVHATENNPLIKYNPSSRQENIYRLYTDKISTDGRKIPYLPKAVIFRLMKTIGKTKTVSVFIENDKEMNSSSIICEFDENGYITISSEFNTIINESEIDDYFKQKINPIIEEIKNFLEQNGYKIKTFNSLYDDNIEVRQITYETQIKINKRFNLDTYKSCLSTIFINESSEYKSGIYLRFKRVSNFNKVTSQEAFILEKQEQGYRGIEIVDALLENFPDDLNREDALQLVRKIANEIQVERGVRKSEIKIKDNPGFKTVINLNEKTNVLTIVIENINDIYYLSTIPIYLDTMVRLTQDKNSTNYPVVEINRLCSLKGKDANRVEFIKIDDIISSSETSYEDQELPIISEEEEVEYSKADTNANTENAFDLFFGDEEEEEEEELEGGAGSDSDSESSIESEPDDIIIPPIPNSLSSSSSLEELPSLENQESEEEEFLEEKLPSLENQEEEESQESLENKEEESSSSEEEEEEESVIPPKPIVNPKPIKPIVPPKKGKLLVEESESESESDEEEEEEIMDRNIDNMSLKKKEPYFQTKIEKLDPVLILKEDTKEYNSYSRVCSSTTRRQPVILTDEELEKINKEHKGFLRDEDIIKYGSDPKKQFNYICPRYWCLKNDTIVDPNDLKEVIGKDGKKELVHPTCGKVLPRDAKKVKPGYYIYEFYQPKKGDSKRFPGFQTNKHPKGFCLPCCFDKYNTVGRIQAKEQCTKPDASSKKDANVGQEDYIMGPEKFPLIQGRWGYLPVQLQHFLKEVNADCQVSKTNTNIKPNHPCLIRHGVEVNDKQSFIACISDAIFFAEPRTKIKTIKEMKKRIIDSLTIDEFIKYQNGNLVTDFYDPNKAANIDIDNYADTKLLKKMNMNNEADRAFYKKVVSAFENFILFLQDDDAIIDHTYLWDIISTPNKYIFMEGINLIIFELPNDDITSNVQIICPSNHYSNTFYDSSKFTLFLIKDENFYEPIYLYTDLNGKINIGKKFKENNPKLIKPIKNLIENVIKPFFDITCKPFDSMPDIYKAKKPLILNELSEKLNKYKYTIVKLVMNFNGKIIGVIARSPELTSGFVPCYPSAVNYDINQDTDYVLMNNVDLWSSYDETVDFLMTLYNRSLKRKKTFGVIPCKPEFKVFEDEMVVGILTETNQFIQISEPIAQIDIQTIYDADIKPFKNKNYIVNKDAKPIVNSDVILSTSTSVDEEREDYIKRIKMETSFYNIFRNTIRILLNDYEHVEVREMIESEIDNGFVIYSQKLKTITRLLKNDLVGKKVLFNGNDNYYKIIQDVSTCIVKNDDTCLNSQGLCAVSDDGKCSLIIPKLNLITHKENEPVYYGRIADEFIRYSRIKSFMFQPQFFLSFGNINYNLRENEIIMIQSSLTQEYFENLVPTVINSYAKYNSYDEVEPIIKQTYDNVITSKTPIPSKQNKNINIKQKIVIEDDVEENPLEAEQEIEAGEQREEVVIRKAVVKEKEKEQELDSMCKPIINNKITSGAWGKCFEKNYKELEYSNLNYCTFTFISYLIEQKTGDKMTVNQIKGVLLEEYSKYFPPHLNKIVDILILEGKKKMGDKVEKIGEKVSERDRKEKITFFDFINDESYFLTPFDLWLLVQRFKVPSIFLSKTVSNLIETNNTKNLFLGYGHEGDRFAFIVIPGLRAENIPVFKLIMTNEEEVFIPIESIIDSECLNKIVDVIQNGKTIEEMLISYIKKPRLKEKIEDVIPVDDAIILPPKKLETRGRKKKNVEQIEVLPVLEEQREEEEKPIVLNIEKPKTRKNKGPYVSKQQTQKNILKRKLIFEPELEPQ